MSELCHALWKVVARLGLNAHNQSPSAVQVTGVQMEVRNFARWYIAITPAMPLGRPGSVSLGRDLGFDQRLLRNAVEYFLLTIGERMSSLKVHSIDGKGDIQNECLWLAVLEDIPDLSFYLVCDTTYTDDDHISNELRHLFWFPAKSVKKGDWVKLATGIGTNSISSNKKGTATHHFYWNLGNSVWNKAGDAATVFSVSGWKTTRIN
ncbi:hypothetical protein ACSEQ0_26210 [Pseudomonas aeruginosa]